MNTFSEILNRLPAIGHISALELIDQKGRMELLENRPGKAGSVAVYNALLQEFGRLNCDAAKRGLELYAEHTDDARLNPGKHPNIDRLFELIEQQGNMEIRLIKS